MTVEIGGRTDNILQTPNQSAPCVIILLSATETLRWLTAASQMRMLQPYGSSIEPICSYWRSVDAILKTCSRPCMSCLTRLFHSLRSYSTMLLHQWNESS